MNKTKSTPHERVATASPEKAFLAIVFPIAVVLLVALGLNKSDTTLADFLFGSDLSPTRSLARLAGAISLWVWIALYYKPAFSALHRTFLIRREGSKLNVEGVLLPIVDITSYNKKYSLLSKSIRFNLEDGSTVRVNTVFLAESPKDVFRRLEGIIDRPKIS